MYAGAFDELKGYLGVKPLHGDYWDLFDLLKFRPKHHSAGNPMYGCPRSCKQFSSGLDRVIGCGHVSGLRCGCYGPRAGMEMRGPSADHSREL